MLYTCIANGYNLYDYNRNGRKSWKIYDLSQCNVSFPCLHDCIDTFAGYTKVDICEENQYEVICGENY